MSVTAVAASGRGLPRDFTDLEDQILRVRWMSEIANDHLQDIPANLLGAEFDKLCHIVRATSELAAQLCEDFYAMPGRRATA